MRWKVSGWLKKVWKLQKKIFGAVFIHFCCIHLLYVFYWSVIFKYLLDCYKMRFFLLLLVWTFNFVWFEPKLGHIVNKKWQFGTRSDSELSFPSTHWESATFWNYKARSFLKAFLLVILLQNEKSLPN